MFLDYWIICSKKLFYKQNSYIFNDFFRPIFFGANDRNLVFKPQSPFNFCCENPQLQDVPRVKIHRNQFMIGVLCGKFLKARPKNELNLHCLGKKNK